MKIFYPESNANPILGLLLNLGSCVNRCWRSAMLTLELVDSKSQLAELFDILETQKRRSRKSQSNSKSKIF